MISRPSARMRGLGSSQSLKPSALRYLMHFPRRASVAHLTQVSPACVLPGFGGIGILIILQPEAEPVDGAALRDHARCRACEDVLININDDEVYWLMLNAQKRVGLPHQYDARSAMKGHDLQRGGD